jgi:hypothetical protein
LGDLELVAGGLQLPVGEVGAKQDHRPADALQQGGADIVDGLRLVGGGERASWSAKLPMQEPLRDDEHAGEDDR